MVAGVVAGEAAGVGDDVTAGLFELSAGSQATANRVTKIAGNSSARLIDVVTELLFRELLIGFPRSSKIEKREDNCANAFYQQWVFPQNFHRNLRSG